MGALNTNELGKSSIGATFKRQRLQKIAGMFYDTDFIKLFGEVETDFQPGDVPFTVIINKQIVTLYLRPTTPQGKIATQGLLFQDNNFSSLFPYSDPEIYSSIVSTLEAMGYTEESASDVLVEDVVTELKKFFYSASESNLFEGDVEAKRYELMVDSDSNISLAKYLSDLYKNPKGNNAREAKAIQEIINNSLIKKLKYEVAKGTGELSTVVFNHSHMEFADPTEMYEALSYLVSLGDIALPSKNGVDSYSIFQLVGDLIAYSFLEGGVQEANQFTKYIPIELLSQFGKIKTRRDGSEYFESIATGLQKLGVNQVENLGKKLQSEQLLVSRFTAQFAQNNIGKIKGVSREERFFPKDKQNTMYVLLSSRASSRPIKEYDKKTKETFLYLPVPNTISVGNKEYREFIRVPVVTNKYVTQYNPQEDLASPVQNENREVQIVRKTAIDESQESPLSFLKAETNLRTVIQKMIKSSFVTEQQAILLENLLEYINPKDNFEIRTGTSAYRIAPGGNTLFIGEAFFDRGINSVIAQLLHEITHAGSNEGLLKFYTFNPETREYEFNLDSKQEPGYAQALAYNYVFKQAYKAVEDSFKIDKKDTEEQIAEKAHLNHVFARFQEIQRQLNFFKGTKDKEAIERTRQAMLELYKEASPEFFPLWYAVSNPLELIPNMIQEPFVLNFFNGVKLPRENRSLLDKIFQRFRNLVKAVFPNLVRDSVSERGLISLFDLMSKTNTTYLENVRTESKNRVTRESAETTDLKTKPKPAFTEVVPDSVTDVAENTEFSQKDFDMYSKLPFERDLESLDMPSFYSETTLSGKLLSTLGITESDWLSLTPQEKQKIKDCN